MRSPHSRAGFMSKKIPLARGWMRTLTNNTLPSPPPRRLRALHLRLRRPLSRAAPPPSQRPAHLAPLALQPPPHHARVSALRLPLRLLLSRPSHAPPRPAAHRFRPERPRQRALRARRRRGRRSPPGRPRPLPLRPPPRVLPRLPEIAQLISLLRWPRVLPARQSSAHNLQHPSRARWRRAERFRRALRGQRFHRPPLPLLPKHERRVQPRRKRQPVVPQRRLRVGRVRRPHRCRLRQPSNLCMKSPLLLSYRTRKP